MSCVPKNALQKYGLFSKSQKKDVYFKKQSNIEVFKSLGFIWVIIVLNEIHEKPRKIEKSRTTDKRGEIFLSQIKHNADYGKIDEESEINK